MVRSAERNSRTVNRTTALSIFSVCLALAPICSARPVLNSTTSRIAAQDYSDVLAMSMFFYEVQKSGDRSISVAQSGISIPWRGDTMLATDKYYAGGFFDAGDYVKFNLPMGYTLTTLAWGVLEFPEGYDNSGQMRAVLAHLKHGAKYITRCFNAKKQKLVAMIGNPYEDHERWTPPESLDFMKVERVKYYLSPTKPGTEIAGEFAAALAAIAEVFSRHGSALPGGVSKRYIKKLTNKAKQIYKFGETHQGKYSDSVPLAKQFYKSFSGYEDELAWGAAWIAIRTGESAWKEKAMDYYSPPDSAWVMGWDDKMFGVSHLIYQLASDGSVEKTKAKNAIETDLGFWLNDLPRLDGTLRILDRWGSNRYASNAAFLGLIYHKKSGEDKYLSFARSQIDYILGDNPDDFSYVIGFGAKYPRNPHHRAAHGSFSNEMNNPTETRHILYGALVGGHEDASGDEYRDKRSDYVTNEVACDYNAGFSGALAGLVTISGSGQAAAIPQESVGEEFRIRTSSSRDPTSSSVTVELTQMTGWPPRKVALETRYFLSLGDLSPGDVDLKRDSRTKDVYVGSSIETFGIDAYVQLGLDSKNAPFPGTDSDNTAKVTFSATSRTGPWTGRQADLSSNSDFVPVYEDGILVGGRPPDGTVPEITATPVIEEPLGTTVPVLTEAPPGTRAPQPTERPTSNPPATDELTFSVSSAWAGGFIAEITGANANELVEVIFEEDVELVTYWNTVLVISEPHQFVFRVDSYGNSFGFQAKQPGSRAPVPLVLKVLYNK